MIIPFLFFAVTVVFLLTMLLFRVWELRAGRLSVREEDVPESFFSIDGVEEKAEIFFRKLNVFFYHAAMLSLSHMIVFLRQVGASARSEWKKYKIRLPAHLPSRSNGSSVYLKDISAHKDEVRRENGYHE